MSLLDEIPGYAEAIEAETITRDASFLPLTETVADFELKPMALRHWMLLRSMRSPLLNEHATPTPFQLSRFLWVLSPDYGPTATRKRKAFLARCRRLFFPPKQPLIRLPWLMRRWKKRAEKSLIAFAQVLEAARQYVKDALQDRPPTHRSVRFEESYYSDAASLCNILATEFGWMDEYTLGLPLKRLFQYLNTIRERHGCKVFFNPSDGIRAKWLAEKNAANKGKVATPAEKAKALLALEKVLKKKGRK